MKIAESQRMHSNTSTARISLIVMSTASATASGSG